MNNTRRKALAKIAEQIEELKGELEDLKCEEECAFDNMPESLQYSEKGERMQEIISNLDDAVSNLEDAIDYINQADAIDYQG